MTTTKPTYRPAAVRSLFAAHRSQAEMHAFSSKERDVETGLSYFGARYYSSDLSVWLSVDPMSDKYPSLSPYVYCADNPILMIDDNGEEYVDFLNKMSDGPNKPPTDSNHPQELEEVVIKAPPTTMSSEPTAPSNKTTPSNNTTNANVGAAPYSLLITFGNLVNALVINPVITVISICSILFQGDTRQQYSSQQSKETSQQINKIAKENGMTPVKGKHSHGQKVYKKGNKYYSRDVDKHNGGEWKVFEMKNGKLKRIGTADKDLNILKK